MIWLTAYPQPRDCGRTSRLPKHLPDDVQITHLVEEPFLAPIHLELDTVARLVDSVTEVVQPPAPIRA